MAGTGINIPVSVEGAAQAEAELRRVAQAAQATQGAGAAARGGFDVSAALGVYGARGQPAQAAQGAADATTKAAEATDELHLRGRRAAASIVGQLNPALGGAVRMLGDLRELAISGSKELFALAGAGVAVGAIALVFQGIAAAAGKAREEIERMHEAAMTAAEKNLSLQQTVADTMEKAGVFSVAEAAAETVRQLSYARGIEPAVAAFGQAARQRAALTPEQTEHIMGAWLVAGRPELEASAKGDALIRRLLAVPEAEAARVLAGRIADVGDAVRAEAPPPTFPQDVLEYLVRQRMGARGIPAERIETAVRVARSWGKVDARLESDIEPRRRGSIAAAGEDWPLIEGILSENARPGAQPVVINRVTNISQQHNWGMALPKGRTGLED